MFGANSDCQIQEIKQLIKIIMLDDMGLQESFDQEDFEELENELQQIDGISLKDFQLVFSEHTILNFSANHFIKNMAQQGTYNIKFVGNDKASIFKAFGFVLFAIGMEEKRNYPHLNTLIKEQFYKPNIFKGQTREEIEEGEEQQMLQKSLMFFEEVSEGHKIEDYIIREPLFEKAFICMLKNSLELQNGQAIYEQLSSKFNIDMKSVTIDEQCECFLIGANKHFYIIKQHHYYFIVVIESKDEISQSKLEMESIRSVESGINAIVEAVTDNSTPKFKNSEVKYRKKSHKNSFGGDLQIVQYRDLLHLKELRNNQKSKVLSEYFQVGELAQCMQNIESKNPIFQPKNTFQDIINSESLSEMKGSIVQNQNTMSGKVYNSHADRRKDRKISASEIIEYRYFNNVHNFIKNEKEKEEREEENHQYHSKDISLIKQSSYKSLVLNKQDPTSQLRMRSSLISNQQLERIDERQSSQRQSTHPDQESEPSGDVVIEIADNDSQVKMKDRKYSYFTQQMASTKVKKLKQIESNDYVFKIPKNAHKNSEVISPTQEQQFIKRRFEQNPMRFSQLGSPSDDSVGGNLYKVESSSMNNNECRRVSMRMDREVYSYMIKFEPNDWVRKEIHYYFSDKPKQCYSFQRTFGNIHEYEGIAFPASSTTKYIQPSHQIRESFGSIHTMLTSPQMKYSENSTIRNPSHTIHMYNPYEMNETSFLKNRNKSQTFLKQSIICPKSEEWIPEFTTTKSLKSIHKLNTSKTKVIFSYTSPKAVQSRKHVAGVNSASTLTLIPSDRHLSFYH